MINDIKKPDFYNVVFFYEEEVSDLFLLKVLDVIFNKDNSESTTILLNLKRNGKETVGKFIREIAETKKAQTLYNAEANNFQFSCELELAN